MVEAVILGMAVLLNVWCAKMIISHERELSKNEAITNGIDVRVTSLESGGSRPLIAHEQKDEERVKSLDSRVAKLESAVIVLQATPGKLEAMAISLQTLHEGQVRIEERLNRITK